MATEFLSKHSDMALNLVDLVRYPIADINQGEGADFLKTCQDHMEEHGWCNFEGFLRSDALEVLMRETTSLMPTAETLTVKRTIYQGKVDPSAPNGDPRGSEYVHVTKQLADDQIPADTVLQRLYKSDILTDFIRQVQKKKTLYRCADEFQALNIVALEPGSWHAWHYDTTECTVTMLLQAAEKGGEFVFLPNSRTDDTENKEKVGKFLAGDMSVAESFSRDIGTFTLFRGGYSLHGVTKVEGNTSRASAILTYSEEPNVILSDEVTIRIYGKRVENILAARKASQGASLQ